MYLQVLWYKKIWIGWIWKVITTQIEGLKIIFKKEKNGSKWKQPPWNIHNYLHGLMLGEMTPRERINPMEEKENNLLRNHNVRYVQNWVILLSLSFILVFFYIMELEMRRVLFQGKFDNGFYKVKSEV